MLNTHLVDDLLCEDYIWYKLDHDQIGGYQQSLREDYILVQVGIPFDSSVNKYGLSYGSNNYFD